MTTLVLVLGWRLVLSLRRARQFERLLGATDAKLMHLERQFERFVPADVVEKLIDAGDALAPERRPVTILFADLRGFTAMSERLDPSVTVDILNGYFGHMIAAIRRHHGHVTELVGDGLLALFGALERNPWQERDAVLAAQAMRAELSAYNRELTARGLPALRFGVGIHCGDVVAGVIGTDGLSKFSVTGDPINVASRIEGLTRGFQVDVLVSDEIRAALDAQFRLRRMPAMQVKGKAEPIQTWHVLPEEFASEEPGAAPVSPASAP